jgi:hypothetical protein
MQVAGTDATAATLDAATGGLTGVTSARTAAETADLADAKAVLDGDKAVKEAQDALAGLAPITSDDTKAAYQRVLDSAREAAAVARRNAGSQLPD